MSWPRQYGLWVTVAFLALLLFVLGALQYRWIGEIGRADAERRQAQLGRAARRFATGLDRELAQVAITLRLERGPQDERDSAFVERLSKWAIAEEMPLVSRVSLLARGSAGQVTVTACAGDASGCRGGVWTPPLEALRQRLLDSGDLKLAAAPGSWIRPGELVESPLALLVPVVDGLGAPGEPRAVPFRVRRLLVIELDSGYLTGKLLPQLAELNFGPPRESEFVVSVVRRKDRSFVYSSDAQAAADGPQQWDLELPLPGFWRFGPEQRFGFERRFGPDRQPGLDQRQGTDQRALPGPEPPPEARRRLGFALFGAAGEPDAGAGAAAEASPWLLVVRHRGGSLEQAVAWVRRRNLAIGLGVLALLGAAAIVLVVGAQRARDLARQQIELVASVTHELNTPLAAIRSAGQNLAHGIVTDPAQVQRYGSLIDHEGTRLTGLVAQVLDFAGIQSASRPYAAEPVSLARVVDAALADLGLVLEQSGLAVSKDVPAELPELLGDAAALRRVVANLLTNAVKFASGGGRVTISATRTQDGSHVVLRVEDAGPGIPPAERSRVFEPFYRGGAAQRNDLPGAGLGLALVRRIVTAHGGRAHIESAAGGGTAVVVELPVGTGQEAP